MSGLELLKEGEAKRYIEPPESPWRKTLGEAQLAEIRKNIRIAPKEYGTNRLKVGDEMIEATGKLHHKMLVSGDVAIMGTSFNFSTGAETNQEQLVLFFDHELAEDGRGIVDALAARSERSVYEETQRRNAKKEFRVVESPDVDKPVVRKPAASPKGEGNCVPAVKKLLKAARK